MVLTINYYCSDLVNFSLSYKTYPVISCLLANKRVYMNGRFDQHSIYTPEKLNETKY